MPTATSSILLAPGPNNDVSSVKAAAQALGYDVVVTTDPSWAALEPEDWGKFIPSFGTVVFLCDHLGLLPSHYLLAALVGDQVEARPRIVVALPTDSHRPLRSTLPYWLANAHWVEGNSADSVAAALARQSTEPQFVSSTNPYRGLVAFSESDKADFFGRDQLAHSLVESLLASWRATPGASLRLLTLVGPSGVGKSSLAFAGVLPKLRDLVAAHGAEPVVVTMKPGSDPLEALAIETIRSESADLVDAQRLLDAIREDPDVLRLRERLRPDAQRLILVVDQFEEVFTLCPDERVRQTFVSSLLKLAAHPDSKASVILTLRADFYGACAAYPELAHAVSTTQTLVPGMSYDELRDAIVKPAQARGVDFEAGLVTRMVVAIQQQASALPLLQFALEQMWRAREGAHFTHELFEKIGGVAGALAQRADEAFERLPPDEQVLFKRVLLRMVQPGEATEDTRRRVTRAELSFRDFDGERVANMCDFLSSPELRLLTGSDSGGIPTLEITHEALLTKWPRFRDWIDSERENLVHRKRLELAASSWIHDGRDDGELLAGQTLTRTLAWIDETSSDLTLTEEEFVVASLAASVRREITGTDAGLKRRMEGCLGLGSLLPAAVRRLADDPSPDVARRAQLLREPPGDIDRTILTDGLSVVGPEEFSLLVRVLADDLSAQVDAALAGERDVTPPFDSKRLLVAGAILNPADERLPQRAWHLIDFLSDLPPGALAGWLEQLQPVTKVLEESLTDRIELSTGEGPGIGELLDLLLEIGPQSVDGFRRVLLALLRSNHHAHAVRAFRAAESRFGNAPLIASIVAASVGGERELLPERLALLCLAGGFESAIRLVPSGGLVPSGDHQVLYRAATHISMLGQAREELAELSIFARTPSETAFALLALCESDGPLDMDLQQWAKTVFASSRDAFVHALAGLLLTRVWGAIARDELDMELATDSPRAERDWWTTRLPGMRTITLVRVRAGTIAVGSPIDEQGRSLAERQWTASISTDLFVADRVITIGEYTGICGELAQDISEFSPTPAHPVVSQTWQEAHEFAAALGTLLGRKARLLREVEWELACRAGSRTAYYYGDGADDLRRYGWYLDNSPDRHSSEPRLLLPNPFGLFDMHGGVYEWCVDQYGPYPEGPMTDYAGPPTGPGRVLRGGGYNYPAADCRSAYRYFTQPENRNSRIGIRVCIEAGADE